MSEQRRWTIRVCPVCGRDDRVTGLGRTRHSSGGERCSGEPVPVVVGDLEAAERRAEELATRARAFLTAWDGPHAEVEDAYDAVEKHVEELRSVLAPPSEPA